MTRILLKDGGTGQELLRRSAMPPHPLWSAKVMMEEPAIVRGVHADYIRAGSRLITLNTYSTTPERLAREGEAGRFPELCALALRLVDEARDAAGAEGVRIAACLPPLHGSYRPDLGKSHGDLLPLYREIAGEQAEGADVMLAETLSAVSEVTASAQAAVETGLPTIVAMTLMDDGSARLRSGEPLSEALAALEGSGVAMVALNCCKPEAIDANLPALAATGLPFGAYANGFTAVEALGIGGTVDALSARADVTPERYTEFALGWLAAGACFLGGCCEVGPAHIEHLAGALVARGHEITGDLA